jgi:methionyl-tRNA synthetase
MIVQYLGGNLTDNKPHSHDTQELETAITNFQFELALKDIWSRIRGLNQLIDEEKPWVLAKTDPEQLARVLNHVVADLLQIADLLDPFLPTTAKKIKQTFGGPTVDVSVGILFPRIEAK